MLRAFTKRTRISGFAVVCLTMVCVLGLATQAQAAVVYGDVVATDVTYVGVTEASADPINDPEPLFGPPTLISPNTLDFDPETNPFAADAPMPDTTDGSLSFVLTSNSQQTLQSLNIDEAGDFSFAGTAAGEVVVARLTVFIKDVNTDATLGTFQALFSETYVAADEPTEGGIWDLSLDIDLAQFERSEVKVVLDNTLQAAAAADSATTAFIRKKDFKVDSSVVPEPASLALMGMGTLLIAWRRR